MDTEIMESELLQEKEVTKESGDDSGHATETEDEDSHDQDHDKDHDKDKMDIHHSSSPDTHTDQPYERQIVWQNIGKFAVLHLLALYGLTLLPSLQAASWAWLLATYVFSGVGITAGAHRLWSHRTYKARLPLRLLLVAANSMAGENSIYTWARDHRTHHKFSETDADPHNAKRGFFFSHVGWLCVRKHPRVISAGRTINMADLEADPLVMVQHRHYLLAYTTCAFLLPTLVPVLGWGEPLLASFLAAVLRYVAVLHFTWLVNSAAHMFGMKPYDATIGPVENMSVSVLALGEGFHNYHHTFPQDYSTSEWGTSLNLTTAFIHLMAGLGWAYDLRRPSPRTVEARVRRTGTMELTRMGRRGLDTKTQ